MKWEPVYLRSVLRIFPVALEICESLQAALLALVTFRPFQSNTHLLNSMNYKPVYLRGKLRIFSIAEKIRESLWAALTALATFRPLESNTPHPQTPASNIGCLCRKLRSPCRTLGEDHIRTSRHVVSLLRHHTSLTIARFLSRRRGKVHPHDRYQADGPDSG
jgi:hypothetical protein